MQSRTFLIIILFTVALHSPAQKFFHLDAYNTDSLQEVLPGQTGKERVITLNMLGISLFISDPEKSKEFTNEARALSEQINYMEGLASAERNLGLLSYYTSLFPEALDHYFNSLRIYQDLGLKRMEATLIYDIAALNYYIGNQEKAIEYLGSYREIVFGDSKKGSIRDNTRYYGGLAIAYDELNEVDSCIKYYSICLDFAKRNNLEDIEIVIFAWAAGIFYLQKGNLDSARICFQEALSYPDDDPSVEALKYHSVHGMGWVYLTMGDIEKAREYLQSTFHFYNNKGFLYWALLSSNDLGLLHLKKKDLIMAKKQFLESERIFDEFHSRNSWYRHDSLNKIYAYGLEPYYPIPKRRITILKWAEGKRLYSNLFQMHYSAGDIAEALRYHIMFTKASDTLNEIRRIRDIMELQIKYETKQKEDQLNLLARENELNESRLSLSRTIIFGMAGLIILIIFLAILLIRQNKLREKQNSLILQQKLFRSQMNPHFLYNSLSSIHNFMIQERSNEAALYLTRFSRLIRTILNSSVEEYILLSEEAGTIENYLELQKARFPERFDYQLYVDDSLNPDDTFLPSMLTQPFVENAIEHGIWHKKSKGNIRVAFTRENGAIVFEVEDDGVGRAKAKELRQKVKKDHKSMGMSITSERIMVLNKALKQNITLNVIDLYDSEGNASGTRVVLKIPL